MPYSKNVNVLVPLSTQVILRANVSKVSHSLEKIKVEVYAEPDAKVCIYGTKILGPFTSQRPFNDSKNEKVGLRDTKKSFDTSLHGKFQKAQSSTVIFHIIIKGHSTTLTFFQSALYRRKNKCISKNNIRPARHVNIDQGEK